MRTTSKISELGMQTIRKFICYLTEQKDLTTKTLTEYTGDLKHFISWFELSRYQEENVIFDIEDVATPTLTKYREIMIRKMQLKATTINRRLITLKRFFDWASTKELISRNPAKPVKLIPTIKGVSSTFRIYLNYPINNFDNIDL